MGRYTPTGAPWGSKVKPTRGSLELIYLDLRHGLNMVKTAERNGVSYSYVRDLRGRRYLTALWDSFAETHGALPKLNHKSRYMGDYKARIDRMMAPPPKGYGHTVASAAKVLGIHRTALHNMIYGKKTLPNGQPNPRYQAPPKARKHEDPRTARKRERLQRQAEARPPLGPQEGNN